MQTPSLPEMWETAVTMWLNHTQGGYVERTLYTALKAGNNDIEEAVKWLISTGNGYLLGLYGAGMPNEVHIDVGGSIISSDFIQVFYPDWSNKVMNITLAEVLKYLKDGKKHINVQLSLL